MRRHSFIRYTRFLLFVLIAGVLILAGSTAWAGGNIAGKWKWGENQTLVVHRAGL